jgi:hypothetical protein
VPSTPARAYLAKACACAGYVPAGLRVEDGTMTTPPLLFAGNEDLAEQLARWSRWAYEAVETLPAEDMLEMTEIHIEQLLSKVTIFECPTLRRRDAYLRDPDEVNRQFYELGKIVTRRVTRFTFVVPFDGHPGVFLFQNQPVHT